MWLCITCEHAPVLSVGGTLLETLAGKKGKGLAQTMICALQIGICSVFLHFIVCDLSLILCLLSLNFRQYLAFAVWAQLPAACVGLSLLRFSNFSIEHVHAAIKQHLVILLWNQHQLLANDWPQFEELLFD
jgi:hypothetical protein